MLTRYKLRFVARRLVHTLTGFPLHPGRCPAPCWLLRAALYLGPASLSLASSLALDLAPATQPWPAIAASAAVGGLVLGIQVLARWRQSARCGVLLSVTQCYSVPG